MKSKFEKNIAEKIIISVNVEKQALDDARYHNLNVSAICNEAIKKEIEKVKGKN